VTAARRLAAGIRALERAGVEGAARDARALLAAALEVPRARLSLHLGDEMAEPAAQRFERFVARRAAREPVAKILGLRQFWGRDFTVTGDVLDPRPETETLVSGALSGPAPACLLDLGTGSGVLAVTLLAEWPEARGLATDVSAAALAVARDNAARHDVLGRLDLRGSDWFGQVRGRFDLIVSNPPYIAKAEMAALAPEVRDHDPEAALTDGGDGLAALRVICAGAPGHLVPGGRLLVEIGWRQGAAARRTAEAAGLEAVRILPDMDGRDRVLCARSPV
jgi:release factor glutamine methyltransferase